MAEVVMPTIVDLGLTLEEVKIGLREVTAYELGFEVDRENGAFTPLPTMQLNALFKLLLDKGVFTEAEYDESARLIYNSELAKREEIHGKEFR